MKHQIIKFIFFSLISFYFISCNENVEKTFSSYKELKESGYMDNGWIPKILPDNSFEIREIHNLDINHVFGTFQYQSDSFRIVVDSLEVTDLIEVGKLLHKISSPEKPEWFIDNAKLVDSEMKFYRYENFILIVSQVERIVYFIY